MIPLTFFLLPLCQPAAAPLQDLCDRVDPPLPDEDRGEEAHPAGDLSEALQDAGEQAEDRAEEESPSGSSPPQVPPKVLTQLSVGDGERGRLPTVMPAPVMALAMLQLTRFTHIRCSMIRVEENTASSQKNHGKLEEFRRRELVRTDL